MVGWQAQWPSIFVSTCWALLWSQRSSQHSQKAGALCGSNRAVVGALAIILPWLAVYFVPAVICFLKFSYLSGKISGAFFPSSKWVFSLLLLSEVRPEIISAPEGTSCPQESWQFTHFLTVGGDAAFIMRGIQKGQDVFVTSFHSFPHNPIWILSMSPSSLVFFTFPNNLAITIIVKA